jgi:hypothetical protein
MILEGQTPAGLFVRIDLSQTRDTGGTAGDDGGDTLVVVDRLQYLDGYFTLAMVPALSTSAGEVDD